MIGLSLFFLPIPLGYIDLEGTEVLTTDDVIFEGRIRQPVNVLQISSSDLEKGFPEIYGCLLFPWAAAFLLFLR